MIRLIKGTEGLQTPLSQQLSATGATTPQTTTPQQPETHVQVPPEKIQAQKEKKTAEKTLPQKIEKKNENAVQLNQAKTKHKEEAAVTKPAKVIPKTPSLDDKKISEALSQVNEELKERENQAQTSSGANGSGSASPSSTFGSPTGEVSPRDPGFASYQGQVRSKIVREWIRTTAGGESEPLRARILVRINASGNVISRSLAKSSGDASFDNSALRAVDRASPLPPPPPGIQAEALTEGFVVDFSSRMLGR
jgi:colicin import membrane protein